MPSILKVVTRQAADKTETTVRKNEEFIEVPPNPSLGLTANHLQLYVDNFIKRVEWNLAAFQNAKDVKLIKMFNPEMISTALLKVSRCCSDLIGQTGVTLIGPPKVRSRFIRKRRQSSDCHSYVEVHR